MTKQNLLNVSLLLLFTFSLKAQIRKCAIGVTVDNSLQKRYNQLQSFIDAQSNENSSKNVRTSTQVINIPVVVHIIHQNVSGAIGGSSNTNISNEQVFSQIKVLNNDFRKAPNTMGFNNNPVGADLEFNFYLATKTPEGLPTNGINRVYSSKKTWDVFIDNEELANLSYWDSNRYLNIWVANLAGAYIGYAEFPTGNFNGLDFEETNERTDGVIIDYTVFGNRIGTASTGDYSYGRSLTHEIGHWFGLIHTWGDSFCGDDYCADTPPTESPNNTTKCTPVFSNCKNISTQNMIENFMDYTPDSCMNVFTNAQKARIRTILGISKRRERFINNAILAFEKVEEPTLTIFNNPSESNFLKLQALMPDYQNFTILIADIKGRFVFQKDFIGFPGIEYSFSEISSQKGEFYVILKTSMTQITKKIIVL